MPAKSVRWKEHAVGRALEVRFDWQGARVTVVAVYQHVWSPAKTVHSNRQDRASLLKALGRCIKQVPHRDTLILAGDHNSSLTKQPKLVGPAATPPRDSRPDEPELSNFLGNHRLGCAQHLATPFSLHLCAGRRPHSDRLHSHTRELGRRTLLGSWKKGGIAPHRPPSCPALGSSRCNMTPPPCRRPFERTLLSLRGCLTGSRSTSIWIRALKRGMNC